MADRTKDHPYGTCSGCGADIWENGGSPGDELCHSCHYRRFSVTQNEPEMPRHRPQDGDGGGD